MEMQQFNAKKFNEFLDSMHDCYHNQTYKFCDFENKYARIGIDANMWKLFCKTYNGQSHDEAWTYFELLEPAKDVAVSLAPNVIMSQETCYNAAAAASRLQQLTFGLHNAKGAAAEGDSLNLLESLKEWNSSEAAELTLSDGDEVISNAAIASEQAECLVGPPLAANMQSGRCPSPQSQLTQSDGDADSNSQAAQDRNDRFRMAVGRPELNRTAALREVRTDSDEGSSGEQEDEATAVDGQAVNDTVPLLKLVLDLTSRIEQLEGERKHTKELELRVRALEAVRANVLPKGQATRGAAIAQSSQRKQEANRLLQDARRHVETMLVRLRTTQCPVCNKTPKTPKDTDLFRNWGKHFASPQCAAFLARHSQINGDADAANFFHALASDLRRQIEKQP